MNKLEIFTINGRDVKFVNPESFAKVFTLDVIVEISLTGCELGNEIVELMKNNLHTVTKINLA
jgi:hypothetical protein